MVGKVSLDEGALGTKVGSEFFHRGHFCDGEKNFYE